MAAAGGDEKATWDKMFPSKDKVSLEEAGKGLKSLNPRIPIGILQAMARVCLRLDQRADSVTFDDYKVFVRRHGTAAEAVSKCRKSAFDAQGLLHPWYHGKIDREVAQKALVAKGNYLIRISDRMPEKYVLSYTKDAGKEFRHVLMTTSPDGSVTLEGAAAQKFASLTEVIVGHDSVLGAPAVSPLYTAEKALFTAHESDYVESAGVSGAVHANASYSVAAGGGYSDFKGAEAHSGGGYSDFKAGNDDHSGGGYSSFKPGGDDAAGKHAGGGGGYADFNPAK